MQRALQYMGTALGEGAKLSEKYKFRPLQVWSPEPTCKTSQCRRFSCSHGLHDLQHCKSLAGIYRLLHKQPHRGYAPIAEHFLAVLEYRNHLALTSAFLAEGSVAAVVKGKKAGLRDLCAMPMAAMQAYWSVSVIFVWFTAAVILHAHICLNQESQVARTGSKNSWWPHSRAEALPNI